MAEEVRFELTEGLHPRRFSRPLHSTALPLFHSVIIHTMSDLVKQIAATDNRKFTMRLKILCLLSLLSLTEAKADAPWMNKADIESQIIGRRIYLAVPLGGEFPLKYYKGGKLDGSGKAMPWPIHASAGC